MREKRKKVGRPPLAKGEAKTIVLQSRVQETEKAAYQRAAKSEGKDLSTWVRETSLLDLGMGLQQAIDAPRYRYMSGKDVLFEDEIGATVISRLMALGHRRASPPGVLRSSMGGGQVIMIDPVNGTLMGASDPRKDGLAIGY